MICGRKQDGQNHVNERGNEEREATYGGEEGVSDRRLDEIAMDDCRKDPRGTTE